MLIHCSKSLSNQLPRIAQTRLEESSPLGSWHCNLYAVEHHDCLLFCHDLTNYAVFIPGLKKEDFGNLGALFRIAFIQSLENIELSATVLRKVELTIGKIEFDCNPNKSALKAMDQLAEGIVDRIREIENFMSVYPPAITHSMTHYQVNLPNIDGVVPAERAMRQRILDIVY